MYESDFLKQLSRQQALKRALAGVSTHSSLVPDFTKQALKAQSLIAGNAAQQLAELCDTFRDSWHESISEIAKAHSSRLSNFNLGLPRQFLEDTSQARLMGASELGDLHALDAMEGIRASILASTKLSTALVKSQSLINIERLQSLSTQWIDDLQASMAASSIQAALDSITRAQSHLPLFDAAVASQIANHWRHYGVNEDIFELSQLYREIVEDESPDAEKIQGFGHCVANFAQKAKMDLPTIFGYLLTLFIFLIQQEDSKMTEERLTRLINNGGEQSEERDVELELAISALAQSIDQLLAPKEEILYVVQGREVLARDLPILGGQIVGSLVPNQSARLLGKRGKWILVEFFDWHSQTAQQGWVLKKYLRRANKERSAPSMKWA